MLLQYLIENIENKEVIGSTNIDIQKIEYNSKKIGKNDVFVAIKGYSTDGNIYIKEALDLGATSIIVENDIDISSLALDDITVVKVNSARETLAHIASVYYEFPSKKLKIIGVTGTKGKTTTAYMIRDILLASSKKVGMIGTIYNTYANVVEDAYRTSPESLDLHCLLKKMLDAGIEYVVMEVSSHALELDRVHGIRFITGIFTNLTQEHLDFHETMDNYLTAKSKLFLASDFGVVNGDDVYAPKLLKMINCKVATYGLDNKVNLSAADLKINTGSVEFKMYINKMLETIIVNIPGRFTVYNALAAIATCSLLNCQMDAILLALANVKVPGRSEIIDVKKTFKVMVDYAHTPSSLEAILLATKKYAKGRIICVFGCGGNRDVEKRALMGEAAGKVADFTIITTDNPRNESPKKIMAQIEQGIKQTKGLYKIIEKRKEAIAFAMRIAWKNDIVIIAGKGHETYQELKSGKKISFDERKIVKEIASSMQDKNLET